MSVEDAIATWTCPYCFEYDTVKGARGPIEVVRRKGGRPVDVRFDSAEAFAAHVGEAHPQSFVAAKLAGDG